MSELITLAQGNGGKQAHNLISKMFAEIFGMTKPLTDSALLKGKGYTLAFTTDSYVVDPLFFPGGDIGKLSICGTVNDLAVSGAEPQYIAASFIIEEGFSMTELDRIVRSMKDEALKAGVRIVAGDTKVVEKGKCDKIFITTSGTGILKKGREHISSGIEIKPGDKIIINGPVGNHAIAVLGAREKLGFTTPVKSDCASLNHLVRRVLDAGNEVRFMRDVTRGGLAAVLNELAEMTRSGIIINESAIPVDEPVKGLCEMFGFDPLYLANEGKVLFVIGKGEEKKAIEILRSEPMGKDSQIIGEMVTDKKNLVILNTFAGGRRILDMPSGTQLPRIC
jgi:hydrogenase expression/formation protein HypE